MFKDLIGGGGCYKCWSIALVVGLAVVSNLPRSAEANVFQFCGVTAAPSVNVITVVNCTDAAGGTISGTATQHDGPTSDTIVLSPLTITDNTNQVITATNELIAQNQYSFTPPSGPGFLFVRYTAIWNGALSVGNEQYGAQADATSFVVTPAIAPTSTVPAGVIGSFTVAGQATNAGTINGPGSLFADISYTLDPGESFVLPGSDVVGTGVPEPSTWAMMLLGFAGLGFAGYRRTKNAGARFLAA